MASKAIKGVAAVHAVQDTASELYFNLSDPDAPRLERFEAASHYSTRLDACTAIARLRAPIAGYEVVRVDRP